LPPILPQGGFDPDKPIIALTFDDGPSKVTPRILDLLSQYGARATFCVVGNRVNSYPDIVRRVVAENSELIGHSWDHKQLTKLSADAIQAELAKTKDMIYETAGVSPTLYRPPYGAVNNSVKAVSASLGLSIINWSIDTKDWKSRNAESVYQAVMSHAADGGIILCHDLYGSTADAMERVIPELIARGYQLVTVSELLSASGAPVEAGNVYYKR
jgi:peptidoglycan/xylan/chitin deacetylase (PgdA/CDA1 family)